MALAMALDGRRGEAEQMLRRAAVAAKQKEVDARVAQNLALVSRISERTSKPGNDLQPARDAAPQTPPKEPAKDAKKSASAPTRFKTAQAD
jgi:Flp pilus assembly protein TadD